MQNNKLNYPLTTGRKAQPYKSIINELAEQNHQNKSFSRKLFSPQTILGGNQSSLISNQVLSGGKSNEKLMDRFIPCRMGENL